MATQRRKRTPKKVAPKRTIWRTLFWLGFKLSLVGAAFMVVFGISTAGRWNSIPASASPRPRCCASSTC